MCGGNIAAVCSARAFKSLRVPIYTRRRQFRRAVVAVFAFYPVLSSPCVYYIRAINLYDIVSRNRHKLKRLYYSQYRGMRCTSPHILSRIIYRYIDTIRLLLYFISLPLYLCYVYYNIVRLCAACIMYIIRTARFPCDLQRLIRGIQQKSRLAAIANNDRAQKLLQHVHCNIYYAGHNIIYRYLYIIVRYNFFFRCCALRGRT